MKRKIIPLSSFLLLILLTVLLSSNKQVKKAQTVLTNPIIFVTIKPGADFSYQLQTFGNHLTNFNAAPRGSSLWIMYPDGTLRNLTAEGGLGLPESQVQGKGAIGVRQPCVHWEGKKALVSIIMDGPESQYDVNYAQNKWQVWEVSNFDQASYNQGIKPVFRKIPNQPNYNNISPAYAADDQILFISDAPIFMKHQLYPQRDEYESVSSSTGIFKLNESTGQTIQIEHAASGVMDLTASMHPGDGRIFFTKWDHLKRDQQANGDRYGATKYGSVDMSDESENAVMKVHPQTVNGLPFADERGVRYDIFPEALSELEPTYDPNENLLNFNHFMFWEMNDDGSGEEVINHAGRHEFGGSYTHASKKDDNTLSYDLQNTKSSKNTIRLGSDAGLFHVKEDPNKPGTFYGTYAAEFGRAGSGRIIEFSQPIGANPEDMTLIDWTNEHLGGGENDPKTSDMTGHYRNPLMLKNGPMLVSHTEEYRPNTPAHPYVFRIKPMVKRYPNDPASTEYIAGAPLTGAGIVQKVKYWNGNPQPDEYNGLMNEVDVVEVLVRQQPKARVSVIEPIEKSVFDEEGVDVNKFQKWLIDNNLALIVSRNTTQRDRADVQQPFNLKIPGGISSMSITKPGKQYDISHFQIFQADMLRAYKNYDGKGIQPGRRVFAMPLHNTVEHPLISSANVKNPTGPDGSVKLGFDGSMAAIVPAGRALTWQTTDPNGKGVVRERNWLSFAKGEIRTCSGCHAINKKSQTGDDPPTNKPEALRDLLKLWQKNMDAGGITPDPPVDPIDVIPDPPIGEVDLKVNKLYQNYPNPFIQTTVVRYYLVEDTFVSLKIYNSFGHEVKTLVKENKPKGVHEIIWDGTNSTGQIVNSGLYIYKMQTAKKTVSKKMSFTRSY